MKDIHIKVSIGLFVLSLAFPGYFLSINRDEPTEPAFYILLIGWIGILDGHVSWFANLFYFKALHNYRRKKSSSIFGFIALYLALIFLLYDDQMINMVPSYSPISGYGLGYMLWVTSIGLFAFGQYAIEKNIDPMMTKKLLAGWVSLTTVVFTIHYLLSDFPLM